MTQTPYQVESFDIVTGKTATRTITPLPVSQRLRPAKPIGKEELLHDMEDLRTSMAEAQSDFDRKDEPDAA
jgi:hypothetical protein